MPATALTHSDKDTAQLAEPAAAGNNRPADIHVSSNLAEDTVIAGVMDIAPGRNNVAMFTNPFNSGYEEMLYID